ncbi:glycine cleavage system T protein [Kockovaella imperatae]|uniref:Aminomethyltransferase n=1 Tax=Kockovaella imperatae TaxID=4999 RepID=A0A1Y1UR49_9TREE|nr:glycine cleavage system T protein [Kockovaella imperatae]ORX40541.1 glycine cleavage system T protein [Kockovaella imperatae]
MLSRSLRRAAIFPAEITPRNALRQATRLISRRGIASTAARWQDLRKTPLYEFHVSQSAKMVPFAGFSMPLSYGDIGQVAAHNHVRTAAGIFDVSHMLQHRFTGDSAEAFLMSLCPTSLDALPPFTSSLSVLLNEQGGIIDDMMVTKQSSSEAYYVVTNAGRIKEDKELIREKLRDWNESHQSEPVRWETLDGWGLLALQGPKSAEVLQALIKDVDLTSLKFGKSVFAPVGHDKVKCHIARGGYTGEDGFEISIPPQHTVALTKEIASNPDVMMIGLGARDSLRLEAGMCLYGHDLNEAISPVEAGLTWTIGKERRSEEASPFPGKSRILSEIANGPSRRRVGLQVEGPPAREGSKIFDSTGTQEIGIVTSGIPSPTTGTNIAMGYVASGHHKKGTEVQVEVRKKLRPAFIRPMPFVPPKYYK